MAKKHKFEVIKYKKEAAWGKPINMKLNTWKGTVGAVKNKEQFTYDVYAMSRHLGIPFLHFVVLMVFLSLAKHVVSLQQGVTLVLLPFLNDQDYM